MSLAQQASSTIVLKKKEVKLDKSEHGTTDPGTSYEVFRNNTTAVEVIVKDVFNKKMKRTMQLDANDVRINRLQADVDRLQNELDTANKSLATTKRGFQTIVREMRKHTDAANSRETDTLSKNLALNLENEKLKILLDSRTKLISRLKKELFTMKRVLKCVVKRICNAPEIRELHTFDSDNEYEDLESSLRNKNRVKFATNMFDDDIFDTTVSKDN